MTRAVLPGRSAGERRARLRELLASGNTVIAPGVTDAAGLRLVEEAGFEVAYVTGAGLANAQFGLPDIGLISQREVVEHVWRLASATDLPLIVDADTGYGGPLPVMRTVRMLADAGAAAVQLEDQVLEKRCGHFDGHKLIGGDEMCRKIEAAVDARGDDGPLIVARTDARGVYGLEDAIARAKSYAEAGADVLFVEAPRSVEEMRVIGAELAGTPLLANIVEGGKTPELSVAELKELGFTIALFANYLMRSMLQAGREALAHLAAKGETSSRTDRLLPWAERQTLFGLPAYADLEQRYVDG
jgi:2-methylisocitrate lyase-like PEP mutase family enzyme